MTEQNNQTKFTRSIGIVGNQAVLVSNFSDDEPHTFTNYYECQCGHEWEDRWSCACDDECGECGATCSPVDFVVDGDDDPVNEET